MYPTTIYCWNVLHGDANIFTFRGTFCGIKHSCIVDFGCQWDFINSNMVAKATYNAHWILRRSNHIDIFITHLHYDHYSLLPIITRNLDVHIIYLPAIPRPQRIADRVYYMLASFVVMRIPGYSIIKDILEKGKIVPLVRGDLVEFSNGLYAKILWPPHYLPKDLAGKLEEKIEMIYEIVERKVEQMGVKSEVEDFAEKIKMMFNLTEERNRENNRLIDENITEKRQVIWGNFEAFSRRKLENEYDRELKEILEKFREVANDISLILKFYHGNPNKEFSRPIALIPGDASRGVLDYIAQIEKEPQNHKYLIFLRASHHGTYYGKYIDEHRSEVVWISWTRKFYKKYRSYPSPEYLSNSNFGIKILAEIVKKSTIRVLNPISQSASLYLHSHPLF